MLIGMKIKLATRATPLALAQTALAENVLQSAGLECERIKITTQPDSKINIPLSQFDKSAFTGALETAVLEGRADCAVHSLKDLGVNQPSPLECVAFLPRGSVADIWVSDRFADPDKAPQGTQVGTSSLRRFWQLKQRWPHLEVIPIRGSVGTRLQGLGHKCEALILAKAGLDRLGIHTENQYILSPEHMLPSPGQGAIVIQMRKDHPFWAKVRQLTHQETETAVVLERKLVALLGGHCQVPLGVLAHHTEGQWWMKAGIYGDTVCIEASSRHQSLETLYQNVSESLLSQGAINAIQRLIEDD